MGAVMPTWDGLRDAIVLSHRRLGTGNNEVTVTVRLPDVYVRPSDQARQMMDELQLRDRFIAETAPLTRLQVEALSGCQGDSAIVALWEHDRSIFPVIYGGLAYYPSFQFVDGAPHPTIQQVLAVLPAAMSAWQIAFWFVSTNSWLEDRAPAELLDATAAVVAAAWHEGQAVIG